MEAIEAKADTEMTIMVMRAGIEIVRIKFSGAEVVVYTVKEADGTMVAEILHQATIDATNLGI